MALRGLSDDFVSDLKQGILAPVLERVKSDDTLCLEIRDGFVNVYYRGGNLLRLTEGASYAAAFDQKYFAGQAREWFAELPIVIQTEEQSRGWVERFPLLKQAMDLWFASHPKTEREYQQQVLRDNNSGEGCTATDYFICDLEYANAHGRFDMVAAKWLSTGAARKNPKARLALIEVKCGDGALKGECGIHDHIAGMNEFLSEPARVAELKAEMLGVFRQKHKLGLIGTKHALMSFTDEEPEYILLLANHDPGSRKLLEVLEGVGGEGPLADPVGARLKFATATFLGYGLFEQGMLTLDELMAERRAQVHSQR